MKAYLLIITTFLLVVEKVACQDAKIEDEEEEVVGDSQMEFPSFRSFFDTDGGFQFNHPEAELEPTKFSINDAARNFPKEAIERASAKEESQKSPVRTRKRRHIPGRSPLLLFNRPVFDGLFFGDIGSAVFNRDPRKTRPRPQRPVYPPLDPFGTTEYIPLPGASSPAYALPVTHENPHFQKPQRFRRPIRQVQYFTNNFLFDSSLDFYHQKHDILRQIKPIVP